MRRQSMLEAEKKPRKTKASSKRRAASVKEAAGPSTERVPVVEVELAPGPARTRGAARAEIHSVPQPWLTAERRRLMIAEAAYLRAEGRGFQGGSAEDDWLQA